MTSVCSIDACDRPPKARGWCSMHYQRWRAWGDPLIVDECRDSTAPRLDRTPRVCGQCGATFTPRSVQRERPRKFCSRKCRNAAVRHEKVVIACEQCGKSVERLRCHVRSGGHLFCSRSCRGQFARVAESKRVGDWRRTIEVASHHGQQWTGPQLEVAIRNDLTITEKALTLGRTTYAVTEARRRAIHDPKIVALLGR